jgi:hypothetical protein
VQHREMVGQLQDELEALRNQVEGVQLWASSLNSGSRSTMVISYRRVLSPIPDFNASTVIVEEEDEVSNNRTHTDYLC